jgi:hypothetical protein
MVCYCTPGLVVLPCHTRSVVWHRAIGSHGTIAVPVKWTTVLALHYSHTVATCPHVLQALTALPTRTSCRPMKALMPGALEMCASALGTCGPSCTSRPTRLFFLHEARGHRGPQDVWQPGALLVGRHDPKPWDTWCSRAHPVDLEP